MIKARLAKNKNENEFFANGRPLGGVSDARIEYNGKGQILILTLRDFELLPASRCPERNRFEKILQAAGSEESIARLDTPCSMLRMNPCACDGCPERPL